MPTFIHQRCISQRCVHASKVSASRTGPHFQKVLAFTYCNIYSSCSKCICFGTSVVPVRLVWLNCLLNKLARARSSRSLRASMLAPPSLSRRVLTAQHINKAPLGWELLAVFNSASRPRAALRLLDLEEPAWTHEKWQSWRASCRCASPIRGSCTFRRWASSAPGCRGQDLWSITADRAYRGFNA